MTNNKLTKNKEGKIDKQVYRPKVTKHDFGVCSQTIKDIVKHPMCAQEATRISIVSARPSTL